MTDRLTLFVAEGFGLGRIPVAPGSFGSLWGIPLGYLLLSRPVSLIWVLSLAAVMLLVGIPLCAKAAKLRDKKDPGSVVWDEIAAFPIVYSFALNSSANIWLILIAGFALFRLFDIWKPWPVKVFDRIEGGTGIMLDDTMAGIMAGGCLWLGLTFVV